MKFVYSYRRSIQCGEKRKKGHGGEELYAELMEAKSYERPYFWLSFSSRELCVRLAGAECILSLLSILLSLYIGNCSG